MTKEIKLPPLPEPNREQFPGYRQIFESFDEEHMKAYATQAVEAYKAQQPLFAEMIAQHPGLGEELRAIGGEPIQQQGEFDDCIKSPTGKHSESWFSNGDCEHCKTGAQPNAVMYYAPEQQPLTDEQRRSICSMWSRENRNFTVSDIIDAVEAAHGIGAKP